MFTTTFGPMFALGIVALLALTLPGAPLVSGSSLGPAPSSTTVSAKIIAGPMSEAQTISSKFWGLDIDVSHSFTLADGANIAATPIVYLRYPGGDPAEQFNDSSSQIFAFDGSVSSAATSISQFISVCQAIHCHSILQLPTEINSSSTAAYLVNYIEHHLGYHPDYWEIGNAPGSWTHYGIPWSKWGKTGVSTIMPSQFPQLVHRYITAIRAVDPTTPIMALGIAVISTYSNPWVSDLTSVDGASLGRVVPLLRGAERNPIADATRILQQPVQHLWASYGSLSRASGDPPGLPELHQREGDRRRSQRRVRSRNL